MALPFESEHETEQPFCVSYRIAGVVLLVNTILVIIENMMFETEGSSVRMGAAGIIIGILLLSGKRSALGWARFALVAGMLIFGGMHAMEGDYLSMGFQLVFSGALLGMILGRPCKVRAGICTFIASFVVCLNGVGLMAAHTGTHNPVTAKVLQHQYNLKPVPDGTVSGVGFNYTLRVPPGWMVRETRSARADNPAADVWLVNPKADAHVLVVGERLELGADLPMKTFMQGVIAGMEQAFAGFETTASRQALPVTAGWERGLITASVPVGGIPCSYKIGTFVQGIEAFQVICFASNKAVARVDSDFDVMIDSFPRIPRSPHVEYRHLQGE